MPSINDQRQLERASLDGAKRSLASSVNDVKMTSFLRHFTRGRVDEFRVVAGRGLCLAPILFDCLPFPIKIKRGIRLNLWQATR
jgi:hypothetical protein